MQDDPGRLIWEDFQNFTTIQIFPFKQIQEEMQLDLGPFASSESDFSQQQQLLQLLPTRSSPPYPTSAHKVPVSLDSVPAVSQCPKVNIDTTRVPLSSCHRPPPPISGVNPPGANSPPISGFFLHWGGESATGGRIWRPRKLRLQFEPQLEDSEGAPP